LLILRICLALAARCCASWKICIRIYLTLINIFFTHIRVIVSFIIILNKLFIDFIFLNFINFTLFNLLNLNWLFLDLRRNLQIFYTWVLLKGLSIRYILGIILLFLFQLMSNWKKRIVLLLLIYLLILLLVWDLKLGRRRLLLLWLS
jgi:hypothetical protein